MSRVIIFKKFLASLHCCILFNCTHFVVLYTTVVTVVQQSFAAAFIIFISLQKRSLLVACC